MQHGDSLGVVADKHALSMRTLAKWNELKPPYIIYANTLLRVTPSSAKPARVAVAGKHVESTSSNLSHTRVSRPAKITLAPEAPGSRRAPSGMMWQWPMGGALAQSFQSADRTRQGIRIAGRAGEQVRAAAHGVVVYCGSGLKGYGNLIIIKHNHKYLSAYGFNRRLLASEGDSVAAGQVIAEVGEGAQGLYLLHFEVRRDGTAVDPILYLPARN